MKKHSRLWAVTGVAAALALAGCWSDSNDPEPMAASTEVPDSAGVSTAAFVSYLLSLNANDESSEPLTIKSSFAVPADDAAEPTVLP
jgi:hypothetical protein